MKNKCVRIFTITGEEFMCYASAIAPRISRRDLIMASTFIYLMRKEEQLCRWIPEKQQIK